MRSLQQCETTPSSDEGRKQVSKGALTTTRNSFPLQELNVATKFMLFFYSDNVTRDTNIKGDPLAAMKFCNSMFRATPALLTQTSLQAANQ